MPNHLTNETSPYLLQHVNNSVDWYPWGPEALEKAIREDKPIFLSIGYSACHWCHVMAHESFENQEIASFMNEYFVNIKVDREERPDLDSIYMSAVVAMTGQGGWPMSVFLTTDCQPFYGGTYFPPVRRHGLPSFSEVLQTVARLWRQDRSRIIQSGIEITRHLKLNHPGEVTTTSPLSDKNLEMAALHLAQTYDWEHGGWGRAPKFPQPMAIEFLLLRAARGDRLALDITNHALTAMAKGGVYDVIGGGFARYSTDDRWLIPHFEKMLYDNAQLSRVYLHAYLITGEEKFRRVCEETLDFIKRELMSYSENKANKSGIFSSLDADSDGEEGKYYLWTLAEIQNVLSQAQESAATISNINWNEFFTVAYNVTEKGNFEGETILQRALDDQDMAKFFGILPDLVLPLLDQMHKALFEARSHRHRPGIDDKVLVAWNALALMSFAEAARYLKRPDYLEIARKNAKFQLSELHPGDRLLRAWRNGRARHNAYLEDYSGLILGLIALYQSDPDPFWFSSALTLADEMLTHFSDPNGGFFDTRQDHDRLIIRPKDLQDNATPSGNALAATALLQLSAYTGNMVWRNEAEKLLGQVQELASRYPVAFSQWLCAIDFALNPAVEVAILGEQSHPNTHALIDVLWSRFRPHCLAAISTYPPPQDSPALLQDRPLVNGLPTAYVCQNFVCQQPVISPAEFASQLE